MFNGRKKIFTSATKITKDNVIKEVEKALLVHQVNSFEETYLLNYRKGKQPIVNKTKQIRSDINHKITINNADAVVNFKNGYFMTKPAYYISRKKNKSSAVKKLNEYLYLSGKHKADNLAINNFHTMGVSPMFVKVNKSDEIPFSVYTLDSRSAFVVYSYNVGNDPVFAINLVVENDIAIIEVYTETEKFNLRGIYNETFTILDDKATIEMVSNISFKEPEIEENTLGYIPIIEFQGNDLRMASFEAGMPIADAINEIESYRQDGIDQFIQSLLILTNCELPDGTTSTDIQKAGILELKSTGDNKADVKQLCEQLDQTQTQVTLQDLQDKFYNVCGMPNTNRSGGGSSDNGSAVYLREGYAMADTCARNTEDNFKYANAYFDKIILHILKTKQLITNLSVGDFELKIEPNTASNLLVKSQSALNLKQLGLAPEIILEKTGLSSDPIADVERSKDYINLMWKQENETTIIESGQQPLESDNVERRNIE